MKILFVGNSHTFYNDMPQTFAHLYRQAEGEKTEVVLLAHPAVDLEWHMKNFFELRFNLFYGKYDYCILQQSAHPFPGRNTTFENVNKINELCKIGNTKLISVLTWAKKDFPEDQLIMNETYERVATIPEVKVSPVGSIWQNVREKYSDINLYAKDDAHASAYGDYLIACTHYALITGKKASNLVCEGYDFLQGRDKCPDNSGVINDLQQLLIKLDESKCRKIQNEIDAYFSAKGSK